MSKITYYRNLLLAAVSMVLGLCIGFFQLTQVNSGFPFKEELREKSGLVSWVQKHKYGIRFGFVNESMNFNYPSKADGQDVVKDSLMNSEGKIVTILYDATDTHSPIYSSKVYHDFFQLSVDGLLVRSYAESEKAWRSDNKLMPIIVALFLLGGIYIWRKTKKQYIMAKV